MGRSAFIARRGARYVFRTRWPIYLYANRCQSSILYANCGLNSMRVSLRTAEYAVAVRRAARIASWMLRMKSASSVEEAIRELFPKLREVAVRPVVDQDDLTERSALQAAAFELLFYTHRVGVDADKVVPGWTEHYRALLHENARAGVILEQMNSVAGRLELERYQMTRAGHPPVVTADQLRDSDAQFLHSNVFPAVTAGQHSEPQKQNVPAGAVRLKMSQALQRYLDDRELQDGDRRAESEVAPIVKFAIQLLDDPVMFDITGDDLRTLKNAIPDIPTRFGFPRKVADNLYQRWKHVQEHGWSFERDGKKLHFKRTSETQIEGGWTLGLDRSGRTPSSTTSRRLLFRISNSRR